MSSSGSSGYGYHFAIIDPPLVIDSDNQYVILVELGNDNTLQFKAASVWYKLQMSPPPATATFGDVPTSQPYFRAIEALSRSGIAAGCGGGNFCPNGNVTRGEMAAFLARALGLHWPF